MRFKTWGLALSLMAATPAMALAGTGANAFAATNSSVSLQQLEAQHPAMQQQLSYGSQGQWVMTLQADLALLGYSQVGPMDGIFGPETESGVKAFQSAENLPVTGVVDPITWQDILSG
ncbi:MAG: peptidoglycan-binding protein, partial [Firmicutes bacterium]|nr:peptidoglycan-binding protein [Bacillota bacterium]